MGEKLPKKAYEDELYRLQAELVKMQNWARASRARIVVIFEGRDAAGKGGTISRVMQYLNPRFARIAALDKPTDREHSQWYFQRYIAHLPAATPLGAPTWLWVLRTTPNHRWGRVVLPLKPNGRTGWITLHGLRTVHTRTWIRAPLSSS